MNNGDKHTHYASMQNNLRIVQKDTQQHQLFNHSSN